MFARESPCINVSLLAPARSVPPLKLKVPVPFTRLIEFTCSVPPFKSMLAVVAFICSAVMVALPLLITKDPVPVPPVPKSNPAELM